MFPLILFCVNVIMNENPLPLLYSLLNIRKKLQQYDVCIEYILKYLDSCWACMFVAYCYT